MLQISIKSKGDVQEVASPNLLVGWGRYKLVSELREMSKKWCRPACWWLGTLHKVWTCTYVAPPDC
jgi:hypothetical protein